MDRVDALVKLGSVVYPVGYDRSVKREPKARSSPMKETGIRLDPECQLAHVQNFLDCVRSRQQPVADVEIGHRSATACHIGTIAFRLGRTVRWDGMRETFSDDREAQ